MQYNITLLFLFSASLAIGLRAQTPRLVGQVIDSRNGKSLSGAHLLAYGEQLTGAITNEDGRFILLVPGRLDSLKCSHLGYASRIVSGEEWEKDSLRIELTPIAYDLEAISVKPRDAHRLVKEAIAALPRHFPGEPLAARGFYRETIRDGSDYLSIAEAVFGMRLFPASKEKDQLQLSLLQGRASEDVKASLLFEDFHPAGGPHHVAGLDLRRGRPTFLQANYLEKYEYHFEKRSRYDGREVYVIAFDQRVGVEEALSRGRLFIEVENKAVLRYESGFSPRGQAYRQHLSGKDKLFAKLLNIDFVQKEGNLQVNFRRRGEHYYLHDAHHEWVVDYRQPKKALDLTFHLQIDLLLTEFDFKNVRPIPEGRRWQKQQLIINLPTAWNESFWGAHNHLSPSRRIQSVVRKMNAGTAGYEPARDTVAGRWTRFAPQLLHVYRLKDTLCLRPLMKARWRDEAKAGMLRQTVTGDFQLIARIELQGAENPEKLPQRGWQQGGLLIRNPRDSNAQNHLMLGFGTAGNPKFKLLQQSTEAGKSALYMDKTDYPNVHLKIIRQGARFEFWTRSPGQDSWQLLRHFDRPDFPKKLEVGPTAFAWFPGNGPEMRPSVVACFSELELVRIEVSGK